MLLKLKKECTIKTKLNMTEKETVLVQSILNA